MVEKLLRGPGDMAPAGNWNSGSCKEDRLAPHGMKLK